MLLGEDATHGSLRKKPPCKEPPKVEPCLAGSEFSPGSEGNSQARFGVNSSLATTPELGIPRYPNYISLEAGWMGQVGWFQGE